MVQENEFVYDVAISFLGSDLGLAEELANLLRDRMSVFLFTERQQEVAGSDGVDTLTSVFEGQARLVVILYREGWGETAWTRVEETAVKNRGLQTGWDSLLLIPLDVEPTVPKWVPKAQIWLSYSHYGLATALPILERKLEEAGGKARPVTAASRAREHARHAEWKEERDRRRQSEVGVDAAKAHVAELFDEIGQAVSEASKRSSAADLAFKQPRQNAARIWSQSPGREGTTVTLYWSQQWANTLDHSGLHIRLWRGYASAAGENIMASEQATELAHHEFDFDFAESARWLWRQRHTDKVLDTSQLAAFCVGLLLDRIAG
jgi:hypothetical protein